MKAKPAKRQEPELISYNTLRIAIGILGFTFPIIMALGNIVFGGYSGVQRSISAYYHTNMQHFFVGILFAIGVFLFTYKGYECKDDIFGNLAGVFAILAALCPVSETGSFTSCDPNLSYHDTKSIIHNIAAVGFLSVLIYFTWVLFRKKPGKGEPTGMKIKRNKWYKGIGIFMLGCVLLIPIYLLLCNQGYLKCLFRLRPVFWLESFALCAFGISWFIKGRLILKD
jgi:hypothetical protein